MEWKKQHKEIKMLTVAGLVPFTTIDFPDKLAAVVFFQGCPLRCPFCHNPNLQLTVSDDVIDWNTVLSFLQERKKRLDGVVLSGGEPLMQPDIGIAVQQIKEMGFQVAIHTSGVYPNRLEQVIPHIDWVGLDVKAPWEKYDLLTGRADLTENVQKSLKILSDSSLDFEVRTTLDPRYLTIDDVYQIEKQLRMYRIPTYALQKYRTFDSDKNPPSQTDIDSFFKDKTLCDFLSAKFPKFICR